MAAPFEQFTRKENALVSTGAPFEQFTKQEVPPATVSSDYEKQFPADIDIPPQNVTPADWYSPQQKAARRQAYLLTQQNKAPEDTWTDKVRAAIEAGGGTATSIVAAIPGIPYGIYNYIHDKSQQYEAEKDRILNASSQNKMLTKRTIQPGETLPNIPQGQTLEDYVYQGIKSLTPDILMPKTDLAQKYQEKIGTALQGVPVLGGEEAIASAPQLAAQFAKAKAGTMLAQKEPVTITPMTIASKASGTSPELHAEIAAHENAGTINPVVARRHIDADSLPTVQDENGQPIKVQLTKGMATQDSKIISDERNVRAANDPVRKVIDDNGKALPLILDKFQSQVSPDINFRNTPEEGQFYIDRLAQVRDKFQEKTREDYQALHDAAEQNGLTHTPLDAGQFSKNLQERFNQQGLYHEDLPPSVNMRLQKIASGELPLTFNSFEQLRTILGREQRKAASGTGEGSASAAHAIGEVRDVLENLPLTPEAQVLKPLADKARASAKLDFDLQNRSPAYKAVVNETATPDDFVEKYILGNRPKTASQQHVKNLLSMFPDDEEFHQALAYSTLNDIKNQAVNSKGQLSSAKLDKAIKTNEDNGKHELLLPLPIRDGLDKLNKTAQLVQGAPAGNYIQSNPNLSAALGHYINSGAYKMVSSIPLIGEPLAGLKQGFQAKKFATESTKPGAGLDYPIQK